MSCAADSGERAACHHPNRPHRPHRPHPQHCVFCGGAGCCGHSSDEAPVLSAMKHSSQPLGDLRSGGGRHRMPTGVQATRLQFLAAFLRNSSLRVFSATFSPSSSLVTWTQNYVQTGGRAIYYFCSDNQPVIFCTRQMQFDSSKKQLTWSMRRGFLGIAINEGAGRFIRKASIPNDDAAA